MLLHASVLLHVKKRYLLLEYHNISTNARKSWFRMSFISEEKMDQMEKDISWDEDPLVFIFHKEQPEKVKMMTHRLNMKDWIRMDKTYPG